MKKLILIIVAIGVVALGWWLISPLFIDTTVNEAFPTMGELENMSEEERSAIKDDMLEHVANQPGTVVQETMPKESVAPEVLLSGMFQDGEPGHQGAGSASLYRLTDGSRIVRLENFSVTNGPALHVFLVKDSAPDNSSAVQDAGYIDLGELKGNRGDQNYRIPDDVTISEYSSVVVYCKPFHVVFSFAPLE